MNVNGPYSSFFIPDVQAAIGTFLADSTKVALEILPARAQASAPPAAPQHSGCIGHASRCNYSERYSSLFSYSPTTINLFSQNVSVQQEQQPHIDPRRERVSDADRKKANEDESSKLIWACVTALAVVVLGVVAYTIPPMINQNEGANEDITAAIEFKKIFDGKVISLNSQSDVETLKKIADRKIEIFKQIKTNVMWKVALVVAVGVGAGTIIGGFAAGSVVVMKTGIALGGLSSLGLIFRWRLDGTNSTLAKKAREILRDCREFDPLIQFESHPYGDGFGYSQQQDQQYPFTGYGYSAPVPGDCSEGAASAPSASSAPPSYLAATASK